MKKTYIIPFAASVMALASCVEDYNCNLTVEKPESVAQAEELAKLDVLNSYIDRSTNPNFTLGLAVNSADYVSKALTYSIAKTNFDAVSDESASAYGTTVADDGTAAFTALTDMFIEEAPTVVSGSLFTYNHVNKTQLDQVVSAKFVKGDLATGKLTLADFEKDAVGTYYSMTSGSVAAVVIDPIENAGNVLQVGSADSKAKNSYAEIPVSLPDGLKLGNLQTVSFDLLCVDETSLKKNLVLILNGVRKTFTGDTPAKRGCPVNMWARRIIELDVSELELTDADRELSEFKVCVGPNVVNAYYYIDNIAATWKTGEPDKYVEKTDAEKAQDLAATFDAWANSLMEVSAPYINEYVVVANPMSEDEAYMLRNAENETELGLDITNSFFLNDYMGDNYVVSLTASLKKAYAANAGASSLKLYVRESGLLGNPGKVQRLLKQIQAWTSAGAQIDGIAVELPLVYSSDAAEQAANEAAVAELFKALGSCGKLVRLDNVAMTNANADYYMYVLKQYITNVAADKRGGIIFGGTGDLWKDATRTDVYGAIVESLSK